MFEIRADQEAFRSAAKALRRESDGKALKRDLIRNLRKAVKPAVEEAQAAIRAMPTHGSALEHHGESLRAAIAKNVKAQIRLTGRMAGVRIRVAKTSGVREFRNAPKRINRASGWRHPVPQRPGAEGEPTWVHQIGHPGWFDDPMQRKRAYYRRAIQDAFNELPRRVIRNIILGG